MENLILLDDSDKKFTSYNVQDFVNGKENILFITGFSGSGKTTFAERLAYKFDMIHIDLDNIDPKYDYIYEHKYSNQNEIFYDFLDAYPELNDKLQERKTYKYREEVFNKFFPFCVKWCHEHDSKKYIIEGTQIYEFPKKLNKNLPIIIMNASAKESADRKYKREEKYPTEILSKENIEKLEKFSNTLQYNKEGEASMINMKDAESKCKFLPLDLDLYYKYKHQSANLGKCKFEKNYQGFIAVSITGNKLWGYIIVKNNKLTAIEVLPISEDKDLKNKLIRLAIDKYGLNEATVPNTMPKFKKLLLNIGFKEVSNINDKTNFKLPSIIIRKNDYYGLIVKRENGNDIDRNKNEFVYYFYIKGKKQEPVGRAILNLDNHEIISIELYKPYDKPEYFRMLLNYAVIEKECITVRVIFGNKELLNEYLDYGFDIDKRVKNSKGKFYVLNLGEKAQFNTDEELAEWMQENVILSEFSTLMKPREVEKNLTGSSHDQAQFILDRLPLRYDPHSILVLEKNKEGKIVKSNTIVYYTKQGKYYWLENCIEDAIGINGPYDSVDGLERDVETKFDYINKKENKLDFVPIYIKFNKPVSLDKYIKSIINLEEV